MAHPRVIVTGSRDWSNKLMIISALNDVYTQYGKFVLVHGNCPTGADKIADDWFYDHGQHYCADYPDTFEAHWQTDGWKAAGPLRNQRMVNSGADLGLSFPLGDSRGTWDCTNKMTAAKIPVRIYDFKSGMYRMA